MAWSNSLTDITIHAAKENNKNAIMRKGFPPGWGARFYGVKSGGRHDVYFGELSLPQFMTVSSRSAKTAGLRNNVD